MQKKLKLGVVADEFFDPTIGRMGGFGWASRQVANCFNDDPQLGVEPVFISGEHHGETDISAHNTRLIRISKSTWDYTRRLHREKFDLLLMIDYRAVYRRLFALMPRTPIIVWARDPRTHNNNARVGDIKIPGQENQPIRGAGSSRGNAVVNYAMKASRLIGRGIQIGYTANFLVPRIESSYKVKLNDSNSILLPNIIDLSVPDIPRSERPKFAFLGRLDPYKRPWLFLQIAEKFPDAEFVVMGQSHFGNTDWQPDSMPDNVRMLGHVGEVDKARELATSWAIINTSVHEGLAVSFQEALKSETPVVSSVNPENLLEKFGVYVGDFPGSGRDSIPHFVDAINRLIQDPAMRKQLGAEGKRWVESVHNKQNFLNALSTLCRRIGVDWTPNH